MGAIDVAITVMFISLVAIILLAEFIDLGD